MTSSIYRIFGKLIDEDSYSESSLSIMISNGFYSEARVSENTAKKLSPKFNRTFYTSWKQRLSVSDTAHRFNTLVHYLHTYVFNGDEDIVSIPREMAVLEEITEYKIIEKLTLPELTEEFISLLKGKVQFNDTQYYDIVKIAQFLEEKNLIVASELEIFSKDLYCYFIDYFAKCPRDVEEFFRYILVYKAKYILIKNNRATRYVSTHAKDKAIVVAFFDLIDSVGLKTMSESFNRYKTFWLSLKSNKDLVPYINKMSKLSKKHHVPFVTPAYKTIVHDNNIELLKDLSINNLVNIICCINDKKNDTAIYKIRNGAIFYKNRENTKNISLQTLKENASSVLRDRIRGIFGDDCTYYIPEYLKIALPKRLKDVVGNLSFNSQIITDIYDTPIVGIYWEGNDLDLSAITYFQNGTILPFAWYRHTKDDPLLFSGDITYAPNGAAELFAINIQSSKFKEYMSAFTTLNVNNFSGTQKNVRICLGKLGNKNLRMYANSLNPDDIVFSYGLPDSYANALKSFSIGTFTIENSYLIYTFNAMSLNRDNIAKSSTKERDIIKYTVDSAIYLNDIFEELGYRRLDTPNEAQHDLSLERLNSEFWSKFF